LSHGGFSIEPKKWEKNGWRRGKQRKALAYPRADSFGGDDDWV
jgi:hypothetical protein